VGNDDFLARLAGKIDGVTLPVNEALAATASLSNAFDLYIPILSFVFGEAPRGSCAVVSFHRLRQEFYGLPANSTVLRERPLKEAVHELVHTLPFAHCEDCQCVMSPSRGVEWIDLKTRQFCSSCRVTVTSRSAGVARG
jgi:archaemetzincin